MTTLDYYRAIVRSTGPDIRALIIVEFDFLGCDGVRIDNPQRC